MSKGKHRAPVNHRRGAAVTAVSVVGATAGMMFSAGPASAETISDSTIADAASGAGLAGCGGLPLGGWVAIALAESGGNTTAHNPNGEDSRGLWQINMRAHSGWVGDANLYEPTTNAWAAKKVCDMQGPSAWSVYTNGSYTQYLSRGAAAAGSVGDGPAAALPSQAPAPAVETPAAAPETPASPALPPASPTSPALPPSPTSPASPEAASAVPAAAPGGTSSSAGGWDGRYHALGWFGSSATREVQQKLCEVGYPVAVDGHFGWQTDAAVKDYQQKNSLLIDGVVGPLTWGHMFG